MKYFLAFIVALVSGKILLSPSLQTNSIHLISHIDRTKSSNKLNQIKYSNNSLLMSFHSKVPYKYHNNTVFTRFLEVNLVHLGVLSQDLDIVGTKILIQTHGPRPRCIRKARANIGQACPSYSVSVFRKQKFSEVHLKV